VQKKAPLEIEKPLSRSRAQQRAGIQNLVMGGDFYKKSLLLIQNRIQFVYMIEGKKVKLMI
jgi:hypothetical protein